jgi:hypothetical protein
MPKKATKKKKAGGKKKAIDAPVPYRPLYPEGNAASSVERTLLSTLSTRTDLVFVKLKQSDWGFSDFTVMLHSTAPLHSVCRAIEEKHGRMGVDPIDGRTTLQLFRHPPNEKNELLASDWHLRLDQVGMSGGTMDEGHSAIIYYNYKPAEYSALLQREPQLILTNLSLEESEAQKEHEIYGDEGDHTTDDNQSGINSQSAAAGGHMRSTSSAAVAPSRGSSGGGIGGPSSLARAPTTSVIS